MKNETVSSISPTVTENVALTAHDLRNIINGIYGLNNLVADKLKGNSDPEIHQLTELINSQCELGLDLTSGLVKSYKQSCFSANKLLTELQQIYQYRANKKAISLTTILPENETFLQTERSKLIRVLDNLLDNSIKFTTKKGKVTLNLTQTEDKKIIISITDTGIGIPDNFHFSLFDKKPHIQRIGTENEPSTGLGLYISKQLMDELNGKIWFESKENIGTTFYLSLNSTDK